MQKAKTFYELVKNAPQGRFNGIKRNYGPEEVLKLRGSLLVEHTLATTGANKLWQLMQEKPYVHALGAVTGNQAVQMVKAGLEAVYLSGWQVAADNNTAGSMYPDQGIYPSNSAPDLCRKINNAMIRADQIESVEGNPRNDWIVPIVADAEAGFGGVLNCYEICKAFIEAGAAGVHFEDQLSSEKKCGHLGGKVLIPTGAFVKNLNAARLAADVAGTPTIIIARTDAQSATLLTNGIDERDRRFVKKGEPTMEGFLRLDTDQGLEHCISRALAVAPYADLIWWETSTPNLDDAKRFAEALKREYPDKMMAYNCSPSFNWRSNLPQETIAKFQQEIGAMGYKFQFITLAGFHSLNYAMFNLAQEYRDHGMAAFSRLQDGEFAAEEKGYTAVKHQREVGTGFFDFLSNAATGNQSSTTALAGSTETAQFKSGKAKPQTRATARAYSTQVAHDIQIQSSCEGVGPRVLSAEALEFLQKLETQFRAARRQILEERKVKQDRLDSGEIPAFSDKTREIRESKWTIKNTPRDLQNRRVEITGPVDRKMVINALNSGALTYMADFEDSTSPTWQNVVEGQENLMDAVMKKITFEDPKSKKSYALGVNPATLMVRPRGWHLPEKHVLVENEPMSGSLFDFGLYAFHNAKKLLASGSGPYFYLPKLQNAQEAKLWDDVFSWTEKALDIPHGSIKSTVLIEHILASFESDEILHALKDHIVGLNCGRWDYIFSYIKVFQNQADRLLPDRSNINMVTPFMRHYALSTIRTCHRRAAHAIGGMAAQIPIKNDPKANEIAMGLVRADKEREVQDGHDGTWVAHPGLVSLASQIFDTHMPDANQVSKQLDMVPDASALIEVPQGSRTVEGLTHTINVTLGYLESWLRGVGCVPLHNLMEDAATAEISRAIMWQWVKHGASLDDGTAVTLPLIESIVRREEELLARSNPGSAASGAAALLMEMVSSEHLPDFLTLSAYDKLVADGQ